MTDISAETCVFKAEVSRANGNTGTASLILALRAALDRAEADKAAAVEALTFLHKAMTDNHKVFPPPHRLQIHDGSWHEGPVVDFVHDLLSVMRDYLAAAIRANPTTKLTQENTATP